MANFRTTTCVEPFVVTGPAATDAVGQRLPTPRTSEAVRSGGYRRNRRKLGGAERQLLADRARDLPDRLGARIGELLDIRRGLPLSQIHEMKVFDAVQIGFGRGAVRDHDAMRIQLHMVVCEGFRVVYSRITEVPFTSAPA